MGHIFWTQFHTLSTLPAMQINEQKKNIHHALSVFDTFPAIFWLHRNVFEANENREWGEYFVPVLDLRPTWDD